MDVMQVFLVRPDRALVGKGHRLIVVEGHDDMVVGRQLELVEIVQTVPMRWSDDQVARRIGSAHYLDDLGQHLVPRRAVQVTMRFVQQFEHDRIGLVHVAPRQLPPGDHQQGGAVVRLGLGTVLEIMLVEDDVEIVLFGLGDDPVELLQPLRIDIAIDAEVAGRLAEDEQVQSHCGKTGGLDLGEGIVGIVAGLAVLPIGVVAEDVDAGAHGGGLDARVDRYELGFGTVGQQVVGVQPLVLGRIIGRILGQDAVDVTGGGRHAGHLGAGGQGRSPGKQDRQGKRFQHDIPSAVRRTG